MKVLDEESDELGPQLSDFFLSLSFFLEGFPGLGGSVGDECLTLDLGLETSFAFTIELEKDDDDEHEEIVDLELDVFSELTFADEEGKDGEDGLTFEQDVTSRLTVEVEDDTQACSDLEFLECFDFGDLQT